MAKYELGSAQRVFEVDDKVEFAIQNITGTGVVLGKGQEGIIDFYIVLLDKPIPGHKNKAILAGSNTLKKI